MCDLYVSMLTSLIIKKLYSVGTKLLNTPLPNFKILNHYIKVFKPAVNDSLLVHSYCVDELPST
jgi:hypothetical protein